MLSLMYGSTLESASMLGQNHVISYDVKSCTYCYYVRCVLSILRVGGNALAPSIRKSLPCTLRTTRQRSFNQRVSCLLGSMARIYNLWDGSLDKRKVGGLVPYCGQDGYRAQVPQHRIEIDITYFCFFQKCFDLIFLS